MRSEHFFHLAKWIQGKLVCAKTTPSAANKGVSDTTHQMETVDDDVGYLFNTGGDLDAAWTLRPRQATESGGYWGRSYDRHTGSSI